MYVESRKMVQMNHYQGRNRDTDVGKGHVDGSGQDELGDWN